MGYKRIVIRVIYYSLLVIYLFTGTRFYGFLSVVKRRLFNVCFLITRCWFSVVADGGMVCVCVIGMLMPIRKNG